MTTRITGMNSGLDVDSLVKTSMKPYQARVDKEVQNKKIMEYQQEQYKQIMNDASDFYDKYLDVLKTGNLVSTSSYQTIDFTSANGDTKVTAKGFDGASIDNYTVGVTQLASKATESLSMGGTATKMIKIGKSEINFDVVPNGYTTVSNYNKAIEVEKTRLNKAITDAADGTAEKKQAQLDLSNFSANTITAKYSEFDNNVVFTASQFGQGGFTLDGKVAADKYLEATIKNTSGKVYTISTSDKKTSNAMTIDNVQFDFKALSTQTSTTTITRTADTDDLIKATPLSEEAPLAGLLDLSEEPSLTALSFLDGTITTAEDGTTTVTKVDGSGTTTTTTVNGITTTKNVNGDITTTTTVGNGIETTKKEVKDGTTTTTTKLADGTITNKKEEKNGTITTTVKDGTLKTTTTTITVPYDGAASISKEVITDNSTNPKKIKTTTNLRSGDRTTTTQAINDGTNTTTTTTAKQKLTDADGLTSTATTTTKEIKLNAAPVTTTTTSTTTNLKVNADGSTTKTVQVDSGNLNETKYNSTTLTGATNVTALKDRIVKFVDDYNTLLKSINTKIFEKRDADYMPLTDEQKKNMSETQITTWEKKAQAGLIRKDSDLERITSAMKSAMSSVMSGTGSYLESIGIKPVKDYTDKNGMFTVDESKLTKALEENSGNIKDLFTRSASTTGNDKGGVLIQLKSALYSEFKTSTSSLSKKAGLIGSTTEYDNTLTKNIYKKKQLITNLNATLTSRENALYKKYSTLETSLQTLNSQQSSLSSMLGTNN